MERTALITARRQRNWSQAAAARMLRISLSHYEKIERGLRTPGVHLAEAINRLFQEQLFDTHGPHVACADDEQAATLESA